MTSGWPGPAPRSTRASCSSISGVPLPQRVRVFTLVCQPHARRSLGPSVVALAYTPDLYPFIRATNCLGIVQRFRWWSVSLEVSHNLCAAPTLVLFVFPRFTSMCAPPLGSPPRRKGLMSDIMLAHLQLQQRRHAARSLTASRSWLWRRAASWTPSSTCTPPSPPPPHL